MNRCYINHNNELITSILVGALCRHVDLPLVVATRSLADRRSREVLVRELHWVLLVPPVQVHCPPRPLAVHDLLRHLRVRPVDAHRQPSQRSSVVRKVHVLLLILRVVRDIENHSGPFSVVHVVLDLCLGVNEVLVDAILGLLPFGCESLGALDEEQVVVGSESVDLDGLVLSCIGCGVLAEDGSSAVAIDEANETVELLVGVEAGQEVKVDVSLPLENHLLLALREEPR